MWLWDDMLLNSPGGSTLQCGRWLWDDMPLNTPKRLPYWNSTSGCDFDHITTVDMSFCTSLRNSTQIGPPSAEKMMSCRFWRWQISVILDFRDPITGFLKSPCLVFEKIAFFCTLATDRQTDESGGLIIIMSRQFLQRHNTVTDSTAPAVQTTNQY